MIIFNSQVLVKSWSELKKMKGQTSSRTCTKSSHRSSTTLWMNEALLSCAVTPCLGARFPPLRGGSSRQSSATSVWQSRPALFAERLLPVVSLPVTGRWVTNIMTRASGISQGLARSRIPSRLKSEDVWPHFTFRGWISLQLLSQWWPLWQTCSAQVSDSWHFQRVTGHYFTDLKPRITNAFHFSRAQ